MNLLRKTVNLHSELLIARKRQLTETQLMAEVSALLDANETRRGRIRSNVVSNEASDENTFQFDQLASDKIFHVDQIRKICIEYRLRFLPSGYFKQGIPGEAINQIRRIEDEHRTVLGGFFIVAPTKAFRLKNVNDPLLFAPIGNGYFYLVHKWGDDLNPWRKVAVWPYRNLFTFTLVTLALSLVTTWLTPESNLSRKVPMAEVIIFLFAFKSIFAVGLYGFFLLGKKFNSSIWNSAFFN